MQQSPGSSRLKRLLFVWGAVVCVCIVMYCLVLGLIIVLLPSISFTEEKYVRRRRLFWLMRINPQNSLFDRHVKYGVEKGLQVRSNSTHTTTNEVTWDYYVNWMLLQSQVLCSFYQVLMNELLCLKNGAVLELPAK